METRRRMNCHDQISSILTKIHRTNASNNFLTQCLQTRTPPRYTFLKSEFLAKVNWSKKKVLEYRLQKVQESINYNNEKIQSLNTEFETHFFFKIF